MIDWRSILVEGTYRLLDQGARTMVSNIGKDSRPSSPNNPTQPPSTSCHFCEVHKNIVIANGYVRGLLPKLNPDGSIPAGLGGTMAQARDHVDQSLTELPQIIGLSPTIDESCMKLQAILPGLFISLMDVSSRQQLEDISARMNEAETIAYSIPEALYRREAPKLKSPMIIENSPLTDEDRELLKELRSLRLGDKSKAEVAADLERMLMRKDEDE